MTICNAARERMCIKKMKRKPALKPMFWRVVRALTVVFASSMVMANTEVIDGTTWTYKVFDGQASVDVMATSAANSITIPSKLGGYPVTSIGDHAFEQCDSLTSVTIPNGVTEIGTRAFANCDSLESVSIPPSLTGIGDHAFEQCDSLTSVTIPNGVTEIGTRAFANCGSLESVSIPPSVTNIGDYAFASCDSLESVSIPPSVTSIGDYAFASCDSLESVSIPPSVTSIGEDAFTTCKGDYRIIPTIIVDGDSEIGSFVITDGYVLGTVLRIINKSDMPSALSLPAGCSYERIKGTHPLTIPALSTNLLTIMRTPKKHVFVITREELELSK